MASHPAMARRSSTREKNPVHARSSTEAQILREGDHEDLREILLTKIGIAVTLTGFLFVLREIYALVLAGLDATAPILVAEQIAFLAIVVSLTYGNLLYQLTRLGYLRRLIEHQPASVDRLDGFYDYTAPTLTILIPSYKEEHRVIKQSILSSALQSYPGRRVVLLIDDPPNPNCATDLQSLIAARRLPEQILSLLRPMATYFRAELAKFERRRVGGGLDFGQEHHRLWMQYVKVGDWFKEQARNWDIVDHTDRLCVRITFEKRGRENERRIAELRKNWVEKGRLLSENEILREYRRLAALFEVEICAFERKVYENLSHEPNKAMNLNSYISLMGKQFLKVNYDDAVHLEQSNSPEAERFPDSDYLINLDADSLLDPDYALRLIHFMEQPENSRIAVVQTPYSAVRDSSSRVERIAGATTDIQYLIHQGFTYFDATYWVGANALIRKRALEDIAVASEERGFSITCYIQDNTVIEDTESSIDLILKDWRLHNYPERLSYSATPPDFGSLIIQRRRWSNGGLIILPKLIRYLSRGRPSWTCIKEGFMRFHYLTSVATVNLSILALLIYPFESNLHSFWLPLTAVPYYFFYGRDLRFNGYSLKDLFQVYVLNLFLIPVNLSGVLKSIYQAISGRKVPFRRTPKVMGKTLTPRLYVICESSILCYALVQFWVDVWTGYWLHAVFALGTGLCFFYALGWFLGLKELRAVLFAWSAETSGMMRAAWPPSILPTKVRAVAAERNRLGRDLINKN